MVVERILQRKEVNTEMLLKVRSGIHAQTAIQWLQEVEIFFKMAIARGEDCSYAGCNERSW